MTSTRLPTSPAAQPCLLLTGFDAFGADRFLPTPLNPSWLAVQALQHELIAGHRVVAAQLPTVFADAGSTLQRLIHVHRPVLIVCVGQAGGRHAVSIERVALNLSDAAIADNAGEQPGNLPVMPGQPAAYFTNLPVHAMQQAVQNAGVPAELSLSAGSFVCNHVFYGLMHALATEPALLGVRGGFIHVPYLPSQGVPSLALADTVRGLRAALACALASA